MRGCRGTGFSHSLKEPSLRFLVNYEGISAPCQAEAALTKWQALALPVNGQTRMCILVGCTRRTHLTKKV